MRVHALGGAGRLDRGDQRVLLVARFVPVVRELRGEPRTLAATGEGERVAPVQLDPLAWQQVRGHDLGHQPVPQCVAVAVVVDPDDSVPDRLPHALEQGGRGLVDHVCQQRMGQRANAGRDRAHHLLGRAREQRDPAQHDLPEGGRQPLGVPGEDGADRLLRDESVAGGALPRQRFEIGSRGGPLGDDLGQRRPGQGAHLQAGPSCAAGFGQRHGEVGHGAGAVGAVGTHDEHRLVAEVGDQVDEEIAGGAIGPLEVLDHQYEGSQLRQVDDQVVERVQKPHRGVRRGVDRR